MQRGRASSCALLALGALLVAPDALAEHVVLVRPPVQDEVMSEALNRLRAELRLQGFDTTVVVLPPSESTPQKLTELAQQQGAFAGISLARASGTASAEVCIADRLTGKTSLRTLALSREADAPSVLAVRAADLLRSSLRELEPGEKPPADVVGVDTKPTPIAVENWTRNDVRFRVDARAAALGATQSLGPGYGPSLGLGYRAFDRIWIGLVGIGPAVGATFETAQGSAKVVQVLGLARVQGVAVRTSAFELRPTLAAGVYHLDAQGNVEPPIEARNETVTSFAGGLGLDASLHLTSALSLGADVSAFLLTPRPGVAVLGDEYEYPWPFVTASLGLAVEL